MPDTDVGTSAFFDSLGAANPSLVQRLLQACGVTGQVVLGGVVATKDAHQLQTVRITVGATSAGGEQARLGRALASIEDLTTEHGLAVLLSIGRQRDVFLDSPCANPCEVAIQAFLDHRAIFEAAHVRCRLSAVRRHFFFVGRVRDQRIDDAEGKRLQLAAAIKARFADRKEHVACNVRLNERKGELSVVVARPYRDSDRVDAITVAGPQGLLSIHTQTSADREFYRALMGRMLFADATWFHERALFTGEPFFERGADALSIDGIPDARSATLHELDIVFEEPGYPCVKMHGIDLADKLSTPFLQSALARGEVRRAKLALHRRNHLHPALAEFAPPNELAYDRSLDGDLVLPFLLAHGFMRLDGTSSNDESPATRAA